jgi:hypothetical protein
MGVTRPDHLRRRVIAGRGGGELDHITARVSQHVPARGQRQGRALVGGLTMSGVRGHPVGGGAVVNMRAGRVDIRRDRPTRICSRRSPNAEGRHDGLATGITSHRARGRTPLRRRALGGLDANPDSKTRGSLGVRKTF